MTQLALRDPHLFLGSTDITEQSSLGVSVNGTLIQNGLTMDYDGDGFLDVSVLATLTPFDANGSTGQLHMVEAQCPVSMPAQCKSESNPGLDAEWTIANHAQGACAMLPPNTTGGYSPAVEIPQAPCFETNEARDLTMVLGGVQLSMTATRVAATYDGSDSLHGLIMGYVTQAKAEQALLPSYVPLLANTPITQYLHDSDRDKAASPNGEDGFWFYLNFVAQPAELAN